jgi:hypothetical protein
MTGTPTHSDLEDRLRSHYKVDAGRVRPRPLELDEVVRLAERASDGTRQGRQRPVEGLVPMIVERQIETARRWPRRHLIIASAVAAAVVGIAVGGLVIVTRNDDPPGVVPAAQPTTTVAPSTTAAQPAAVAQPPTEFTACIEGGPDVHRGTEEQVVVPVSDGEMTITQSRDFTFRQSLTSESAPRLEGTLYQAWDQDEYNLPGDEASTGIMGGRPTGVSIVAFTNRIENDEGAWEGSAVMLNSPDGTTYVGPMVMTGEGAYEGLTAIIAFDGDTFWEGDCVVSGYIIEGSIPALPTPQTGQ